MLASGYMSDRLHRAMQTSKEDLLKAAIKGLDNDLRMSIQTTGMKAEWQFSSCHHEFACIVVNLKFIALQLQEITAGSQM